MRLFNFSCGLVIFLASGITASGQSTSNEYYVTIGVYGHGKQDYAVRYTDRANKAGFNAQYAINPKRKLYYVYLLQSDNKKKALAFMIRLRAETEYKDSWVFVGHLGEEVAAVEKKETPVETVKETPVKETIKETIPVIKETVPEITPVKKADSSALVVPKEKKKAKGKFFVFQFINQDSGNEVRGEIHVLESKVATQYQAFKANEMVDVPAPRNSAGVYFISTIAPGYKAFETSIDFKDPQASVSETGPNGELIIPLHLVRVKRGDYIEFNNVGFYRSSVIMHPEFKDEMDGLAEHMKEHLDYVVRIHGHCNGNENRNIITLGTSTKYFESDHGNHKLTTTAKELTDLRADCAKKYLVSQGIAPDRILIKGEGGKMMVYPQNSVYANYNDRIEVEIVKH